MPVFTVLRRVDAYADYVAEIEAATPEEAADLAYDGEASITWEKYGVTEFDACRVVTLDKDGDEIESTTRGKA